jgi:endonuclease/exonuclease/phosphatase family metal-dependent hydrolase
MTFNLRYREADDGANGWDRRKALALARIRAFNPDLLGVQECSAGPQAAYLRRHLRDWTFHGVRTEDADWPVEMAPILVRRGAFDTIATGHFWLSETPAVPSKSWDADFARTATWAELRHLETGRSFVFLNTHVDYQPQALKRSAQVLGKWIGRTVRRVPIIVTGDFNADKRSPAYPPVYRRLTRGGLLRDVFREGNVRRADEGTFHGYGSLDPPLSIDWILVSRHFTVVSADVDRHHTENRFPSDHYPVTTLVGWKRSRQRTNVRRRAAARSQRST